MRARGAIVAGLAASAFAWLGEEMVMPNPESNIGGKVAAIERTPDVAVYDARMMHIVTYAGSPAEEIQADATKDLPLAYEVPRIAEQAVANQNQLIHSAVVGGGVLLICLAGINQGSGRRPDEMDTLRNGAIG